jgi:hypothetical protein
VRQSATLMRSLPPLLFSKFIPSTLIDRARHPVWGLSSRYFDRASIIRWQSICEVDPPMFLLARNPRAAERDTPSTKPARDYPAPKQSIIPIRPEVVATNRLDQAQRPIGHLPIMGRTLPITLEEPTEEVGDRRDQGSDRAAADRERGLDKREDDPEQGVIDMIGCLVGRSPRSGTQGLPPHFTFLPGAPHGTSARYAGWLLLAVSLACRTPARTWNHLRRTVPRTRRASQLFRAEQG